MSQSEYVLGFVAILVGVAVADIAASLHRLLRARARVRWHWLPLAATGLVVLLTVQLWWSLTSFERLPGGLTVGLFLPLLVGLLTLFLLASVVLPDEVPAGGVDLRSFYFAEHRYFWLVFTIFLMSFVVFTIPTAAYYRGREGDLSALPTTVPNLLVVGLALSLAATSRPRWHQLWLVLLHAVVLASMFTRQLM